MIIDEDAPALSGKSVSFLPDLNIPAAHGTPEVGFLMGKATCSGSRMFRNFFSIDHQ